MRIKLAKVLILLNLLALFGYFNWSVLAKEKIVSDGELVLLKLEPIDPRSLMQGDYMELRYEANEIAPDVKVAKRGFCVLRKDRSGVARRIRFQEKPTPLNDGELLVKYFTNTKYFTNVHVGAESYFFEEGSAKRFEAAKYGAIRVDESGNSVLVGLCDDKLRMIKP